MQYIQRTEFILSDNQIFKYIYNQYWYSAEEFAIISIAVTTVTSIEKGMTIQYEEVESLGRKSTKHEHSRISHNIKKWRRPEEKNFSRTNISEIKNLVDDRTSFRHAHTLNAKNNQWNIIMPETMQLFIQCLLCQSSI